MDRVVSQVRLNDRSPLTWRDVEYALAVSRRDFDRGDDQSSYVWSTLALAVLEISQSDVRSIRSRIRRAIVERSGHARKLEAYAHEIRGTAATELDLLQLAREEFERAKDLYHRAGDNRSEVRLGSRLAYLELLAQNWIEAELVAENALRQMSDWGTAKEKGDCVLTIGHAQFRTHRLKAAMDSAGQILAASGGGALLEGQAYLLRAMTELESGQLIDAVSDCQKATRLFEEAGNTRGLRKATELQARLAKK